MRTSIYQLAATLSLLYLTTGVMADDLYHYWPLEEGSGGTTANLGTSGAGPATVNNVGTGGLGGGGAAWITNDALRGTVISGNGDNSNSSFVTTAGIPDTVYNANWTISGWVQLSGTGSGGNDVILGNRFGGPGNNWAKLTPNNFEWRANGGGNVNITNTPSDGVWRQYTIVKNGNTIDAYINGVFDATNNFTQTFPAGNVPFFIGGDSGGERPEGRYDDVGFFDDALEQGKIVAITEAANNTNGLDYDLGDVNELFKLFDGEQDSVEIDGVRWLAATTDEIMDAGLLGPIGVPQSDGDRFAILFSTPNGGVITAAVPEPTSVAIWSLIGLACVGFGYLRVRNSK